jgi:hypothetical protein
MKALLRVIEDSAIVAEGATIERLDSVLFKTDHIHPLILVRIPVVLKSNSSLCYDVGM